MKLDDAFWPALWNLAIRTGTRPEVFLTVWFAESGLDPAAENAVGCIGLNQTCPRPRGPGFPTSPAAYKGSPASVQVAWIGRQVAFAVKLNGGPFRSAARYWQANLLPATLAKAKESDDVIAGKDGPYPDAYAGNAALDADKDGRITLVDLGDTLERLLLARGTPLGNAIQQAYAQRPADAPWDGAEIVLYEPDEAPEPRATSKGGVGTGDV